jgi:hypothetical protein
MNGNIIPKTNILDDDNLVNLIKTEFNENDMHLFNLNYKIYKEYKTNSNPFIVDLEVVYKWIGFSRKDPAKLLLIKDFSENKDYIIKYGLHNLVATGSTNPYNKEYILLFT